MIQLREFGSREFKSVDHAFAALVENASRLISLKKAQVYKSFEKGQASVSPSLYVPGMAIKGMPDFVKKDNFYPVINTTKYFDSHGDVHLDNLWDRSLKHQAGSLYYVDSHSLKADDVIAWPEDVRAFVKNIPWALVGKDYPGETQALIYEIPKAKIEKASALRIIESGRKVENSVRMQYVSMKLAVNSESDDFKEHKDIYDELYPLIANKEAVEQAGYFWAIEEAKIMKEGSLVLAGSNDATSILYNYEEPGQTTSSKSESSQDTPPFNVSQAIQKLSIKF
jgi:hypothetical protein